LEVMVCQKARHCEARLSSSSALPRLSMYCNLLDCPCGTYVGAMITAGRRLPARGGLMCFNALPDVVATTRYPGGGWCNTGWVAGSTVREV